MALRLDKSTSREPRIDRNGDLRAGAPMTCTGIFTDRHPNGAVGRELRQPADRIELAVGQSCAVPPGRPHHAQGAGGGRCRYVLVQGIGPYDAVPVEP